MEQGDVKVTPEVSEHAQMHRMRLALDSISGMRGKTFIDEFGRTFEEGAMAAFEQCANVADIGLGLSNAPHQQLEPTVADGGFTYGPV